MGAGERECAVSDAAGGNEGIPVLWGLVRERRESGQLCADERRGGRAGNGKLRGAGIADGARENAGAASFPYPF